MLVFQIIRKWDIALFFFTKINGVHESTPTIMSFLDLTVRVTIRFLFSKKYVSLSNLVDSGLGKLGLLIHESLCSLKQEVQERGVWDNTLLLQPGISNWK